MSLKRKCDEESDLPAVKRSKISKDFCTKIKKYIPSWKKPAILKHLEKERLKKAEPSKCQLKAFVTKIEDTDFEFNRDKTNKGQSNEKTKSLKNVKTPNGFIRLCHAASSFLKKVEYSHSSSNMSKNIVSSDNFSSDDKPELKHKNRKSWSDSDLHESTGCFEAETQLLSDEKYIMDVDKEEPESTIPKENKLNSFKEINKKLGIKPRSFSVDENMEKCEKEKVLPFEQTRGNVGSNMESDKLLLKVEEENNGTTKNMKINFSLINKNLGVQTKSFNVSGSKTANSVDSNSAIDVRSKGASNISNLKRMKNDSSIACDRNSIRVEQEKITKPRITSDIQTETENKDDAYSRSNLTGMRRKYTWPLMIKNPTAQSITSRLDNHWKMLELEAEKRKTRPMFQPRNYSLSSKTRHSSHSISNTSLKLSEKDENDEKEEEKYTFFWRKYSPFSQHHACSFIIEGVKYNCAEQYMMYRKAALFGDEEMVDKVMATSDPVLQKKYGRMVKNFNIDIWKSKARNIVKKANIAKFSQNAHLRKALMDTEGTVLVEASPCDHLWGIGLSADNIKAKQKATWRGQNWLGYCLTDVRETLKLQDNAKM